MKYLPFPASADAYSWKRAEHVPKGFRLYSSADWLRKFRERGRSQNWFLGDHLDAPQSSGSLAAKWLPETFLDWLIDGEDIDESGRYMTVSERLRQIAHIAVSRFCSVRLLPHGAPVFLDNHGPAREWLLRAAEIWAALPENDSEIFDRPAVTESPKHAKLATGLAPLLQWRRMGKPIQPVSTNWMQADNDNYSEDHADARPAVDAERRYRAGPEPETLVKMAGPVDVTFRHARYRDGRRPENGELDGLPLFPAAMGKLGFSNGEQRESCYVPKDGKAKKGTVRLPRGAILHYQDEFTEWLGSEPDQDDVGLTRAWAARVYGQPRTMDGKAIAGLAMETSEQVIDGRTFMVPRPFKPAGRIRRKVKMTQEEQLAVLATHPHPPVTYCPPSLPNGSAELRGIFAGAEIMSTKGKSGVERWEDLSDEMSRQSEFERWAAALPPEQIKALDLACTVANFREIGEAFGKTGKTAEREGKKRVLAANDNLKKIMAA